MSGPAIGLPVHYVARGSADGRFPSVCRAAWVTEVDPEDGAVVGLFVANPSGLFFHSLGDGGVVHDDGQAAGGVSGAVCGSGVYPGGSWHYSGLE